MFAERAAKTNGGTQNKMERKSRAAAEILQLQGFFRVLKP
jgi:hypothetical protein